MDCLYERKPYAIGDKVWLKSVVKEVKDEGDRFICTVEILGGSEPKEIQLIDYKKRG